MWLSIANLVMQKWLEGFQFLYALVYYVVSLFVLTVAFYIAGVIVVGGKRALLSDAFVISLLGTIIGAICQAAFRSYLIGMLLSLLVWLLLIKHYYETGWLGAIAVGILAVIVGIAVLIVLGIILGFSFWLILIGKEALLTILIPL
jgi:hypothetical protein